MESILIVDDSSVARSIVRRCLSILGLEEAVLFEAGHGQEALDVLGEEEIDLIVTDLNMPVMDGVTLLRKVKASPRLQHVPVIVVSSILNEARKRELRERGVEHMVEKPISPALLGEKIEQIRKGEES